MRVLKDIDFIKWNRRLEFSGYKIDYSKWSTTTNGGPSQTLSIFNIITNRSGGPANFELIQVNDPFIRYKFAFSVAENRKDEFFKIQNNLINKGIANRVHKLNLSKENKEDDSIDEIVLSRDIISDFEEKEHMVDNKKYIKYSYSFGGKLTSIISYITILEDTIEFFQNIWGYDKDGKEHNILSFPIGNIVSLKNDKSTDLMVIDYTYNLDYDKYTIGYIVCEIESKPNSLVMKYGDQKSVKEADLTWSRNDRIDNILN